jgi:8-amino-7-oxononanoate synthase
MLEIRNTSLDDALAQDLDHLDATGLRRRGQPALRKGTRLEYADGSRLIDFASNDYLGLAGDARLARAAGEALLTGGTGSGAARLISGTHPLHEQLESRLAVFKGVEAALLFGSGYAANVGSIPALAGRGDIIYSDELNHASLIDGCRLSDARIRIFPHLDLDALARLLEEDAGHDGRRWIVVEGVYSMDGDPFPLDRLVEVARAHGAWTYVDDAHGTGVLGAGGRGSAERWGVEGEIDVMMGTLGKALGTTGAFVCGSRALCEWLLNRARSFVFTTAPPPAMAAATLAALEIVASDPGPRTELARNAARLARRLADIGLASGPPRVGHIVPIMTGAGERTLRIAAALAARGFAVGAIRPPSVPDGGARLRITVSAAHSAEQIDGLSEALHQALEECPG